MPDKPLYSEKMNDTATTTGGYVGSKMYKTGLNKAKEIINGSFGSSHVLNHREPLTNAMTGGHGEGTIWVDSTVELPNETMILGCYRNKAVGYGEFIVDDDPLNNVQLAAMMINPYIIKPTRNYDNDFWLRDIISNFAFAIVYPSGSVSYASALHDHGVRPVFGIVG